MKARYTDKNGSIETAMENDGKFLSLTLRGVKFAGNDFDSLQPVDSANSSRLGEFTFSHGNLCACTFDLEIPIALFAGGTSTQTLLYAHLELGEPCPNGLLDRVVLFLKLADRDREYSSSGHSGWFEDELLNLQHQLPEGVFPKACITCAFSDYHPAGHGLFGGLACFRGNKDGYKGVKTNFDLFQIWNTRSEFVQETHLCPEFERRRPKTGYRG